MNNFKHLLIGGMVSFLYLSLIVMNNMAGIDNTYLAILLTGLLFFEQYFFIIYIEPITFELGVLKERVRTGDNLKILKEELDYIKQKVRNYENKNKK